MILSAVPTWMNEVVPPKNRGAFVDIHGASLLFGYAVSAWIGLGFFHLHNEHNNAWRAPMGISESPLYIEGMLTLGSFPMSSSSACGYRILYSARKSSMALNARPLRRSPSSFIENALRGRSSR